MRRAARAFALVLVLLVSACAQKGDLVALLPDPDGNVGAITITPRTAGAETVEVDQANTAVRVAAAVSDPVVLSREDLLQDFGDALGAQPTPPRTFILYFEPGRLVVTPESDVIFDLMAAEVRRRETYEIVVIGHTDRVGSADLNARLSLERADAVRSLLIDTGFEGDLITALGFGESMPLVPTADGVENRRNRRVEVVIR